jgi:hypothetical protein
MLFPGADKVRASESLTAYGHTNLRGTHKTTLEITKAANVTPKGDCIVAVNASKSLCDLDKSLKAIIVQPLSNVVLTLEVNEVADEIRGFGDPRLSLTSDEDIVCRKSNFASERTLMVRANKAAIDIDRRIIQALKDPRKEVYVTIQAEC